MSRFPRSMCPSRQVVNLLTDLQAELGIAMLFISHDLRVVRQVSRRIAVMYLGRIVEEGDADDLFARPEHPYTRALVSAAPVPGRRMADRDMLQGDRQTRLTALWAVRSIPAARRSGAVPHRGPCACRSRRQPAGGMPPCNRAELYGCGVVFRLCRCPHDGGRCPMSPEPCRHSLPRPAFADHAAALRDGCCSSFCERQAIPSINCCPKKPRPPSWRSTASPGASTGRSMCNT